MSEIKVFTVSLDNPDYKSSGKIVFRPTKEKPTNVPMFIQAQVVLKSDYDAKVRELEERSFKAHMMAADNMIEHSKDHQEVEKLNREVKTLKAQNEKMREALVKIDNGDFQKNDDWCSCNMCARQVLKELGEK
jgi:RNA polymerase-binding transcription factor DksA